MYKIFRIDGVFLVLLCVITATAQEENRQALRHKLQREIERIADRHDGVLGVAIKDLATGDEILFQDKLTFPTGSSIKIPVLIELYRQGGVMVGKVLRGTKSRDLPIERPNRFVLVVNLKTAKTLGITLPPSVLGRADRVVE